MLLTLKNKSRVYAALNDVSSFMDKTVIKAVRYPQVLYKEMYTAYTG